MANVSLLTKRTNKFFSCLSDTFLLRTIHKPYGAHTIEHRFQTNQHVVSNKTNDIRQHVFLTLIINNDRYVHRTICMHTQASKKVVSQMPPTVRGTSKRVECHEKHFKGHFPSKFLCIFSNKRSENTFRMYCVRNVYINVSNRIISK